MWAIMFSSILLYTIRCSCSRYVPNTVGFAVLNNRRHTQNTVQHKSRIRNLIQLLYFSEYFVMTDSGSWTGGMSILFLFNWIHITQDHHYIHLCLLPNIHGAPLSSLSHPCASNLGPCIYCEGVGYDYQTSRNSHILPLSQSD